MPSLQPYRDKALACIAAAETMRDPVSRSAMLQVAHGYIRLAEHLATWRDLETNGRPSDIDQLTRAPTG